MHFDRERSSASPKFLSDNSKFENQRLLQTVFILMQDLSDLVLYQRKLKDSRHQIRSMDSQIWLNLRNRIGRNSVHFEQNWNSSKRIWWFFASHWIWIIASSIYSRWINSNSFRSLEFLIPLLYVITFHFNYFYKSLKQLITVFWILFK
jgi:hypothetical protein